MGPLTTVGTWFIWLELIAAGWSVDQTCLGRIPMPRKLMMNGAYGPFVLKMTVFGSGAVTLSRCASSWDRNRDVTALYCGSYMSWNVKTTSSEVIGWPSYHLRPSFSVTLYITWSESTFGTATAISGSRLAVCAFVVMSRA